MLYNKKVTRYIFSFVILTLVAFIFPITIEAASISINVNTSLDVGATTTLTVSIPGVTGRCNISSSNPAAIALSTSAVWIEKGTSESVTVTAKAAGTSTITVTPTTLADDTTGDDVQASSKQITITAKEKVVTPPPVENNNATNNNANTNNNNVNNNNTTTQKSGNNYLASLELSEEGLNPNFSRNVTNYSMSVGEGVQNIEVNARAEDARSAVYVDGNENLQDGDNNIYITVVAQNGARRTYTIVVNKSSDPIKSNSFLANLVVKDMVLTPEFSKEVLEYDGGTIKTNESKLEIYAYPEIDNATVEIIGNENLVDGENTVKIKITSENGLSTKEYVIKFIKEKADETEVVETNAYVDTENDNKLVSTLKNIWQVIKNNALLLIMYLLVIVEYVQIVYLYKKLKQKENNPKNEKDFDENVTLGREMVDIETKSVDETPLTRDDIVNNENSNNEYKRRNAVNNISREEYEVKDLTQEKKDLEKTVYDSIDKDLEDINKKLDNLSSEDAASNNEDTEKQD